MPADYASIKIVRQIHTRLGSDDDMEANSSTFHVEMREIAFIVGNLSERSLVIIDELGRGTSTREGIAIATAVFEHLAGTKVDGTETRLCRPLRLPLRTFSK